jgi:metal-dependent amidase/aminoacylase/carboxypeptidase family protein
MDIDISKKDSKKIKMAKLMIQKYTDRRARYFSKLKNIGTTLNITYVKTNNVDTLIANLCNASGVSVQRKKFFELYRFYCEANGVINHYRKILSHCDPVTIAKNKKQSMAATADPYTNMLKHVKKINYNLVASRATKKELSIKFIVNSKTISIVVSDKGVAALIDGILADNTYKTLDAIDHQFTADFWGAIYPINGEVTDHDK